MLASQIVQCLSSARLLVQSLPRPQCPLPAAWCSSEMPLPSSGCPDIHCQLLWLQDVKCHGSYASCFAMPEAQQADLLAVHLAPYSEGLEWRWKELTGKIDGVSLQGRWKASMQLARLSKQLLQQVREDLKVSSGFSGLYVPTFCAAIHCAAVDMPADKLGAFDEIDNDANHSCTAAEPVEGKWSHPCTS